MAYFKKKSKELYLTEEDRKRIANMESNPYAENRKLKVGATFAHPKLKDKIYIICYGKDESMLKESIQHYLDFFQSNDNKWKLEGVENLKAKSLENTDD